MTRRLTAIGVANTLARGLKAVHGKTVVNALEDLAESLTDAAMALEFECEGHPELERRCRRDAQFLDEVACRLEDLAAEKADPPAGCTCDRLPKFDMDGSRFSGRCRWCEEQAKTEAGYDKLASGWIG